jgi:outer membrane protein assembly factor BamD (BamD/ComL family)
MRVATRDTSAARASTGVRDGSARPVAARIAWVISVLLVLPVGCAGGPPEEVPAPEPELEVGGPIETPPIDPAKLETPEHVARLQEADQALRERRYGRAIELYQRLLESFPQSTPTVESIRASLLEAQFLSRDYDAALATSEEILEGQPSASTIQRVLERRYEIGLSYLNGATRRILGLSVSAEGAGLEILDGLVEKYPFQAFADDAVYHIANFYLRREDYAEAEQLFQRLLRDYPQSPWAAMAEYRIGEASLKRLKGVEYDLGTLESAERRFKRYLKLNPAGDQAAQARENLAEIEGLRAKRWLKVAEFYLKFDKEDSARVYLRKLRENHPQTDEGRRAAELLAGLDGGGDAKP